MNTDSRIVTPSLFLGRPPRESSTDVYSVEQAVQVIEDGGAASLPRDGIEMVRPVLKALGVDDEQIEARLRSARNGGPL